MDFKYIEGSLSVLVSAPHCQPHLRKGSYKANEVGTEKLINEIHKRTNCHIIYLEKTSQDDPNYNEKSPYRDTIKKIIKEKNIRYVLDLHGASSKHPFDIDLGTMHGKTMPKNAVEYMKKTLQGYGFKKVFENHTFSATYPHTITHTSFYLGVLSMQFEIHRKHRSPLSEDLVNALSEIVLGLDMF